MREINAWRESTCNIYRLFVAKHCQSARTFVSFAGGKPARTRSVSSMAKGVSTERLQGTSGPPSVRLIPDLETARQLALDIDWPRLYYSYMNYSIAFALMHAGHRVEARLEEALAGVGLSGAKHAALSFLVSQDHPLSL